MAESKKSVYAAIAADAGIALSKFVAAAFSGSSGRDPAVERAPRPVTMHLGPHEVLLALDVRFRGDLSVSEVREAVERLERAIRKKHPEIRRIFLEVNSLDGRHDSAQPDSPVEATDKVVGNAAAG
jgi:divalent metal cation (Fe/Co/Zn/Cd) transporter